MAKEFLGDRRKLLEDEFFSKCDQALLQTLRGKREAGAKKQELSKVSGICNTDVLDALVAFGIDPETLAALALVPLVEVAWADGVMEPRERSAVLQGARESGLEPGDVAYQLLEGWLDERPGRELIAAWKLYINDLSEKLSLDARESLSEEVLGRARAVAKAAGGFLGLGNKISSDEERVLAELEQAFV